MEPIQDFARLISRLRAQRSVNELQWFALTTRIRGMLLPVACTKGLLISLLVADTPHLLNANISGCSTRACKVYEATSPDKAAQEGVALVREGHADVLMKGIINTDNLLRAVLNKEHGLLPQEMY